MFTFSSLFLLYDIFFGCKGTHFFANKPRNNY